MAVYKRGYQRYQGRLTGPLARLLVLPRFAWQRLMEQRLLVVLLVVSLFWPLACGVFVYLSNHADLLVGFDAGTLNFLTIDARFFVIFMNAQSVFAILLAAFAGPSLIAPDLANGALQLYFSRPLSRAEYMLARLIVLLGVLSPITWIPGLVLFLMQSGMAGWLWFSQNWYLGAGIFAGFLLWIALVSLVAMASSACVRWRMVAGGLVLGVFFVLAGASEMAHLILNVEWVLAMNPGRNMNQIWCWLLGAEPVPGPSAAVCFVVLALMAGALLVVLERRLRPVEVVS